MEMWWIWAGIVVLVLFFFLVKVKHKSHRFSNFMMLLGVVLLLVGSYLIYTYLTEPAKVGEFASHAKTAASWMVMAGKNIGRITGYAIHQNWTIQAVNNSTVS